MCGVVVTRDVSLCLKWSQIKAESQNGHKIALQANYFTLSLLEAFACKVDNVLLTVGTALSIPDITDVKLTDNELIGSWWSCILCCWWWFIGNTHNRGRWDWIDRHCVSLLIDILYLIVIHSNNTLPVCCLTDASLWGHDANIPVLVYNITTHQHLSFINKQTNDCRHQQ